MMTDEEAANKTGDRPVQVTWIGVLVSSQGSKLGAKRGQSGIQRAVCASLHLGITFPCQRSNENRGM